MVAGEQMRRLCVQYGWAYGVSWKLANAEDNTGMLTVDQIYCEEQVGKVVDDMLEQVGSVKNRIIRDAASSRKNYWLFADFHHHMNVESIGLKGDDLWTEQFASGIKTISVISLDSEGVAVFGSCEKIFERMEFVNDVNHTLEMSQFYSDTSVIATAQISQDVERQCLWNFSSPIHESRDSFVENGSRSREAAFDSGADLFQVFDSHLFTSLDALLPCPQSSILADDHMLTFDTQIQQDLPFSLGTCSQKSNLTDNDFSTVQQQIFETIEMQHIPNNPLPTSLATDLSVLTPDNEANAPIEALISGGSLHTGAKNCCLTGNLVGNSNLNSKEPSEFTSYIPPQPSESASMITFSECLGSHSNLGNGSLHRNFSSRTCENVAANSFSCGIDGNIDFGCDRPGEIRPVNIHSIWPFTSCLDMGEGCPKSSFGIFSGSDLFGNVEFGLDCNLDQSSWEDLIPPQGSASCRSLNVGTLDCMPELTGETGIQYEKFCSDFTLGQTVGSASIGSSNNGDTVNPVLNYNSESLDSVARNTGKMLPCQREIVPSEFGCSSVKSVLMPECNFLKVSQNPPNDVHLKSKYSSWIDDCNSMNVGSSVPTQSKNLEEPTKMPRKRARPGESSRPRPKDRQLIQDRVKELREIVPNSAKCSIDSLLDRTIKHMIYLKSVTKYADKLKQADETKLIGEESGVVLRDNSSSVSGGATWAFEVAAQTMVCPIFVEDTTPPGQMLIEMLCEERGLFLEIADVIHGFSLTILKGVMEVRDGKIWSRFLVEASRKVTRMDIFLSLVELLQQANSNNLARRRNKDVEHDGLTAMASYKLARFSQPICLGGDAQ